MKKNTPPDKRPLSRKEMLRRHRHREYQDTKNELNEFSRRALAGLQYHPEEEPLEATLKRLDQRLSPHARRSFPIRNILSIAAAAILLLATGYFLFLQPPGNQQLFAQHFDYLPSAVNTSAGDRNLPSTYDQAAGLRSRAMQAYEAGQYLQALKLMEQHLAAYENDTEIRFYLGITLLGAGDPEGAIRNLEAALANLPRPAYERPVKWYLALAFLRDGRTEVAQKLLLELEEGKDRYANESRAVLGQM